MSPSFLVLTQLSVCLSIQVMISSHKVSLVASSSMGPAPKQVAAPARLFFYLSELNDDITPHKKLKITGSSSVSVGANQDMKCPLLSMEVQIYSLRASLKRLLIEAADLDKHITEQQEGIVKLRAMAERK